jgi:hypothetical protein
MTLPYTTFHHQRVARLPSSPSPQAMPGNARGLLGMKRLAPLLCLLLAVAVGSGCATLQPTTPPEQTEAVQVQDDSSQLADREGLRFALAAYTNGRYAEAGRRFNLVAQATQDPSTRTRALLSAALADLLAAQDEQQMHTAAMQWERLSTDSKDSRLCLDHVLFDPFPTILLQNRKQEEQIQSLVTQLNTSIDQFRAAEGKLAALRQQVADQETKIRGLEELFNLLEQQKRQLNGQ